tara:strand:- start:47 stop:256 length:210 start_codon:yes stop_codon:yes gene_type:complete
VFKRLRKAAHPALVFSLFMIVANSGYAKIYKWVDEDGKVHFSDRKDHSVEQELVSGKTEASPSKRSSTR